MKQVLIVGIIAVAIIGILLVFAVMFGYIDNPLGDIFEDAFSDSDDPPSSEYCDFSEAQILEMIELIAGKNLDNGIGIGFVRSMDMKACGTNQKTPVEIREYYMTLYADDWYIITDQSNSGAGWVAYGVSWGNDPVPASSTWVKSIITGGGTAVNTWYGYDTVTITGEGTSVTYLAFAAWLASS